MRHLLACLVTVTSVLACPVVFAADPPPPQAAASPAPPDKPHIDVVFCIDCSGSMGGVIETAKQKVWAIVNQIAKAKPAPELRIGLIGYGNADRSFRSFPLSNDLDEVFRNLLTFRDEGWGDEYVGLAIHKAAGEMKWSEGKQVHKVIYVVGNETARQGPPEMDYAKTAPAAIAKGIVVNAIYCGDVDYQTAPQTWREFAKLADGSYTEIAGQGGAVVVATPYDSELSTLSSKLNTTYVGYGRERQAKQQLQSVNDAASARLSPSSAADRAGAKVARQYDNSTWDLIDASRKDANFDFAKLKEEDLPDDLRKLKPEERKAYVEAKAKERTDISKQIQDLSAKRDAFIKEEVAKKGLDTNKAFDEAVRKSITEQASKRGFEFKSE